MIEGFITSKHVVVHAGLILREFGVATFLLCVGAVLTRRKTTFLALCWRAGR